MSINIGISITNNIGIIIARAAGALANKALSHSSCVRSSHLGGPLSARTSCKIFATSTHIHMSTLRGPRCVVRDSTDLCAQVLPEALKNLALRLADGLAEAGSAAFKFDSWGRNYGYARVIILYCTMLSFALVLAGSSSSGIPLLRLHLALYFALPIGPMVVPFGGSYFGFYKVIPRRNYYGAFG